MTKILVINGQNFGHDKSFGPKNWSFIRQNFGNSFAGNIGHSFGPKFWPLNTKNWSEITKKLVTQWPKNW